MTFEQINEQFSWGSTGFCRAVVDNLGFQITIPECRAIASKTSAPAEFQALWEEGGNWEA